MSVITAASIFGRTESLSEHMSGALSFEELAQLAVKFCAHAAHAQISTLWRVYVDEGDCQRLRLAAAHGVDAPQTLAQEITYAVTPDSQDYDGVSGYVASQRKPVLVHSFEQLKREYSFCHQGKMDVIQWKGEPHNRMRNLYAVPLTLGKELVGVLKVENREGTSSFTDDDVAAVNALAEQIAVVAKALLILDSHERRLIDAPARLSQALVQPFETGRLTQDIVNTIAETLSAEVCSLWLADRTGQRLEHHADSGFRGKPGQVPPYFIGNTPSDDKDIEGITAWVAIRRRPFWANSHEQLRNHPSWRGKWDKDMFGGKEEATNTFRSMYAVPLVWNNELLGVLKVENPKQSRNFSVTDRLKCDVMANYIVLLLALTRQLRIGLIPGMAHILNSPAAGIAVMLGQLDNELKKESPNLSRLKEYVDLIKRNTLTIAVMSRTLSAEVVSRVGPQDAKATELIDMLQKQLEKLKPLVPAGIEFRFEPHIRDHHLALSQTEKTSIEVVMFNLVHNAFKFSRQPGGVVVVDCSREPGFICCKPSRNSYHGLI